MPMAASSARLVLAILLHAAVFTRRAGAVCSGNMTQTKTYKDVYFSRLDKYESAVNSQSCGVAGQRHRSRRAVATLPLLRFKVDFTVIHKGAEGKVSTELLKKQLASSNQALRGKATGKSRWAPRPRPRLPRPAAPSLLPLGAPAWCLQCVS